MTKEKTTVAIATNCVITVTDITGFYSTTNTEGFILESESIIPTDSYKISNGYFITILLYNPYNKPVTIVNSTETYRSIITSSVDSTFSVNFPAKTYSLSDDGVYTVKNFFIISKEFYDAEKASARFDNKTIVYVDNSILYKVVNNVASVYAFDDFLNAAPNFTGTVASSKFVSTCYLNKCYYRLQSKIIDNNFTCDIVDVRNRDFIYMTITTIEYLKELNNSTEIQKIIEIVNSCGTSICKQELQSGGGCGCA